MRLINAEPLIEECEKSASIGWNKFARLSWYDADTDFARRLKDAPAIKLTPCDVYRHNPPSSGNGKPCSMCPAESVKE